MENCISWHFYSSQTEVSDSLLCFISVSLITSNIWRTAFQESLELWSIPPQSGLGWKGP